MSTSHSPLRKLRAEAEAIAQRLKQLDVAAANDPTFKARLEAARQTPHLKFGVVMDDKVFTVEIPWPEIDNGTVASLAAFVLRLMRGSRETVH